MKIKCAYLVILLSCFAYGIFGAGQGIITYQGMAALPNGQVPPDGKYDMKFSLWDIASGGTEGANK